MLGVSLGGGKDGGGQVGKGGRAVVNSGLWAKKISWRS
jgi:hypothetical protein